MTIWILALLFLSCSAVAGFCFGAIRTACSLIGLLVASVLAFPLAHYMTHVVGWFGLKNPMVVWAADPILAFFLVLIAFKIIGLMVHQKVTVYYKYKAGDLRQGLWNRMNVRVGLCLGLVDGAIYTVLVSLVLCLPSYATTQLVMGEEGGWIVKTVNLFGRDAQSTGMNKIIAGLDPLPPEFYPAMDMAGLLYHNDLLEARLGRYPAFMALGERPEYQAFATDKAYLELRQKQAPVMDIINHPAAQNIINNPALLQELWNLVIPNLADLENFLRTGQSPKFDGEKIVGRWSFDLNGALRLLRIGRPNLKPSEMAVLKQAVLLSFAKTTLMAAPGGEVFVKNYGTLTYPEGAPRPGLRLRTSPPTSRQAPVGEELGVDEGVPEVLPEVVLRRAGELHWQQHCPFVRRCFPPRLPWTP